MARHLSSKVRREIKRRRVDPDLIQRRRHFLVSLFFSIEMRWLMMRTRSAHSRAMDDRSLFEIDRTREIIYYRFEGVRTRQAWCISDIPAVWPDIDRLRESMVELEQLLAMGRKVPAYLRKRVFALEERITTAEY
jgi:hypothetical protein